MSKNVPCLRLNLHFLKTLQWNIRSKYPIWINLIWQAIGNSVVSQSTIQIKLIKSISCLCLSLILDSTWFSDCCGTGCIRMDHMSHMKLQIWLRFLSFHSLEDLVYWDQGKIRNYITSELLISAGLALIFENWWFCPISSFNR